MLLAGNLGYLRLYSVPMPENFQNFWQVPTLLMQKLPADKFTTTTKLTFTPRFEGEKAGLIMTGMDYAYLALTNVGGKLQLTQTVCTRANEQGKEVVSTPIALPHNTVYLRVAVQSGAKCQFSYSLDGQTFQPVGSTFQAREGRWIGTKMGLFCTRNGTTNDAGYADVDWFRVE